RGGSGRTGSLVFYFGSGRELLTLQAGIIRGVMVNAKHGVAGRHRPPARVGAPMKWRDIIPDDFSMARQFKKSPADARADERVAVREPLSAGDELGVKVLFLWGAITPDRFFRQVSSAPLKRVVSVLIYGKDQFVDGREVAIRATCAVVKDKKVAGPVQALRDPIGAM